MASMLRMKRIFLLMSYYVAVISCNQNQSAENGEFVLEFWLNMTFGSRIY